MISLTQNAHAKFDLLNKHKVFIRQEQIEEVITLPSSIKKHGKYFFAKKEGVCVVYKKEGEIIRVYTFFPIKK